jgi:branched-chain amino acid transport system permease protein
MMSFLTSGVANRLPWRLRLARLTTILWVAISIALFALPFMAPNYLVFQATLALCYAVAIFGLSILMGYGGQISIGHGAFFALGGYVTAIMAAHFSVAYWILPIVSAIAGLLVGLLLGRPIVRIEGFYLALTTFALAIATPSILKNKFLESWTGGVQGLLLSKPQSPVDFLNADQWLYFFTLAITLILFRHARNFLHGRIGRTLLAIRDNPLAAASAGINIAFYKTFLFGISAAYAAIGGSLAALAVQFVSPDAYTPLLSVMLKVGAVVGGLGSIVGALIGASFVQFVPDFAGEYSQAAPWAFFGLCLLLVIRLVPNGVAGTFKNFLSAHSKSIALTQRPVPGRQGSTGRSHQQVKKQEREIV